jgi:hypothetical protein
MFAPEQRRERARKAIAAHRAKKAKLMIHWSKLYA